MAIDLETLPAIVRQRHIETGRNYGSEDTLAQANATLAAVGEHGDVIADHGFGADDVADLTTIRDAQMTAGVGREAARSDRKTTSTELLDATKQGKHARLRGRSVLTSAERVILGSGRDADAARSARSVIERTSRSGASVLELRNQLDHIREELSKPAIAAAVETRGGAKAVAALAAASTRLTAAERSKRTTTAETEHLDLLDGIIVSLVRGARRAARSAALELGSPAVAKAFELSSLYRARSGAAPSEEPPTA